MRCRCVHCTETYRVSESASLYPQSFCGKRCEIEAMVDHFHEDFVSWMSALDADRVFVVEAN